MRTALSLLLLGTALLAEGARAEPYRIEPAPRWATRLDLPSHRAPSATASGDVHAILADVQVHRAIEPPEAYFHYAVLAVNEQGVPEISQLTFSFNPAYETLLLHGATIHRGGADIPIPIRGHVRVLQREERLEHQIYDGTLTAVLLVDDVRPGDIVEWSFTLRGANPVLASQYSTGWSTATTSALGLLHRRLLWPAARKLHVSSRGATVRPTVTRRGDIVEYALLLRDVPRIDMEPGVPGWYDPLRPITLTSLSSWADVARWGAALFEVPATLTPEMRARIAEFNRAGRWPEERAMAAVQFVQNEIRYLGIEIGENSHRATEPGAVLTRRFGDCKDKALLLVTFLRALGFEAQPALVNTVRRDSIDTHCPSALAFDHVIVRTRSQGKTYWIDATDTGQRGDGFMRMPPPPFGLALVLSDTTRGLSRIVSDGTLDLTTIEKKFDARLLDGPATLNVRTDYYGSGAAANRVRLRAEGREALARGCLDFYRIAYPKIVELDPIRVEDDEALNHLRIIESYSIPGFWQKDEGEDQPYADASAIELAPQIPRLAGGRRTMPLGLGSAHRTIYTAAVDLPQQMMSSPVNRTIRTPALVMISRKSTSQGRLSIYHEFVRSRDHLTAEEANAAIDKFETMELALTTEIAEEASYPGGGGFSLLPFVMALMAGTLTLLLVIRVDRAPAPTAVWRHGRRTSRSAAGSTCSALEFC
jgi:transglutaminase-like putative cysteine protease